jgi:hypothetical protein
MQCLEKQPVISPFSPRRGRQLRKTSSAIFQSRSVIFVDMPISRIDQRPMNHSKRDLGICPTILATIRPHDLASVQRRALAASGIVSAFKHLWSDSWGARTEYLLYHGVRALLDRRRATLIDLPRIYTDEKFRSATVRAATDPVTRRFWEAQFAAYAPAYRAEVTALMLNNAGQFTSSPNLRLILGQLTPKFTFQHAMDRRQILIANLSKRAIAEQASNVLGSLLVSHIQLTAMTRSALPPDRRVPHFIHVDEFQSFTTDAFASIFSSARKFAAHFCLANQYTEQVPPLVRAAVLGNAGSLMVFCVSASDAKLLAPEFGIPPQTLAQQPPFEAWLRRGSADRVSVQACLRLVDAHGRRGVVVGSKQAQLRPRVCPVAPICWI